MRYLLATAACLVATLAQADHELVDRDLVAGEAIYAEQCATCHGAKLEGQPNWRSTDENGAPLAPPHDASGHTWHHDNMLLFSYTKLGGTEALAQAGMSGFVSGMPGFGGTLTDDQIWDVLGFIRSTWPVRVQEMQASRNPPHDP